MARDQEMSLVRSYEIFLQHVQVEQGGYERLPQDELQQQQLWHQGPASAPVISKFSEIVL